MLSPHEFTVGPLGGARPMALFMPGSKYQFTALVVASPEDKLQAVVLDGEHKFKTFDCTGNTAWRGMLVHSVEIEIDEKSVLDLDRFDPPLGVLTRKGDSLSIASKPDGGFRVNQRTKLIGGLPVTLGDLELGFLKWCVVIGSGINKRTLFTVDLPRPKAD